MRWREFILSSAEAVWSLAVNSHFFRRLVWLVVVCTAIANLIPTRASFAAAEPKTVLILQSYGQNFKPWSEYLKGLRQELERRSPSRLIIQDFSVITARAEEENAEYEFVDYLRALVQSAILTENDTVIPVRQNIPVLFGNILQLLPDTKTVAVVIGDSPNERFWTLQMERELEPLKNRVTFIFDNELSFDETLKQAASLPPNSAIFWVQPQIDAVGAAHEGDRALTELFAVANAPIFSYSEAFFTGEIVGGPMASVSAGTKATTDVALRVLAGEKPAT